MTRAPFVVAASPVSRAFREGLEAQAGASIDVLDLAQLRRLPLPDLLRTLRAHKGAPALLAVEDDAARSIAPVLHAVAALAQPSSIEIARTDLTRERRTHTQLVSGLVQLVIATGDGLVSARASRRDLAALARAQRISLPARNLEHALYLNTNLWFGIKAGGSVGHIAGVVNGLVERGITVDFASTTEPILLRPEAHFDRLDPPRAFSLPLELNFPRFQRRVVRHLLASGGKSYGFLYQRLSVGNFAGVVLSRAFGVPLILEYNGSEVWAARNWGRPLRYEAAALAAEEVSLKHAHLVVTVSAVLADELEARGVAPDRIVWYPNGVDAQRYHPDTPTRIRGELGIEPDALVVGFIGTFGRWHGVDVLARAFAHLVENDESWVRERRVHLLLVGDGYRMPEVRDILRDRAKAFATLTGLVPQEEGPAYLAAADILVSPHVTNEDGTRFFGSPTKLFEYMAMGRPILASDLEQLGEILQPSLRVNALPATPPGDDEAAIAVLAEPGSVQDLMTGLRFLVEGEDWRRRLAANARARVLDRHTWSHHVAAIMERVRALGDAS